NARGACVRCPGPSRRCRALRSGSSRHEAHAVARADERRPVACRIEHDLVRRPDESPAARRSVRIDARLSVDDANGTGRHMLTRTFKPCGDDAWIEPAAIRPSGTEAGEGRAGPA